MDRLGKTIVITLVEESAASPVHCNFFPHMVKWGRDSIIHGAIWVSNGSQLASSCCWEERQFCYQGTNHQV